MGSHFQDDEEKFRQFIQLFLMRALDDDDKASLREIFPSVVFPWSGVFLPGDCSCEETSAEFGVASCLIVSVKGTAKAYFNESD